jgi:hypothetical protein
MMLIAIFVLIFLVGFSLFTAVLGSSFLRKHARTVLKRKGRTHPTRELSEREMGERFRSEYREGVEEIAEEQRAREQAGVVPAAYAPPVRLQKRTGMWVLISVVIAVVLVIMFFFGYERVGEFYSRPRLIFCEDVDYIKLKPIGSSTTFTRGNVTIFIKSGETLDAGSATLEISRIGPEGPEYYDEKTVPIRPHWTSFSLKVLFDRTGSYSVKVLKEDGNLLGEKTLFIVPDSYAYRAVPKP